MRRDGVRGTVALMQQRLARVRLTRDLATVAYAKRRTE
jgi:hypothetical protein